MNFDELGRDIYVEKGYKNRRDYLQSLSNDNNVDIITVLMLADLLGKNEDFDGLVTAVQDAASEGL